MENYKYFTILYCEKNKEFYSSFDLSDYIRFLQLNLTYSNLGIGRISEYSSVFQFDRSLQMRANIGGSLRTREKDNRSPSGHASFKAKYLLRDPRFSPRPQIREFICVTNIDSAALSERHPRNVGEGGGWLRTNYSPYCTYFPVTAY